MIFTSGGAYEPQPTSNAIYRVKVLDQDLYVENVPGDNAHLKLSPLQASNRKQKWRITHVKDKDNVYHIVSAEGNYGLTFKNSGYGFPIPHRGHSSEWLISPRTSEGKSYSKIFLNGRNDPFDSNPNDASGKIIFFYDQDTVAPKQCYVFEKANDIAPRALDIMFLQDSTGSQSPYIDTARAEINQICRRLVNAGAVAEGEEYLRVGLIAFRDHPPQDNTFVTQEYPFTTSISVMASNLKRLIASGGGDGPEAQIDALRGALNAQWREDATKIAILITDSAPHGLGESGDGFPRGCPCLFDPVNIAHQMSQRGIILYVVACEPTLSRSYTKALDFYTGITRKTGGKVLPLGNTQDLADLIVGSSAETVELENLVNQYQNEIKAEVKEDRADVKEISDKLYARLQSTGAQVQSLTPVNFYNSSPQAARNAQMWFESTNMAQASSATTPIYGDRISNVYKDRERVQKRRLEQQPITYEQVESVVRMGIARSSTVQSPGTRPQAYPHSSSNLGNSAAKERSDANEGDSRFLPKTSTDTMRSRSSMEENPATAALEQDQDEKSTQEGKSGTVLKNTDTTKVVNHRNTSKTGAQCLEDEEKGNISLVPGLAESGVLIGRGLAGVWSALLLSILLIALDNTIISTALPKMTSHFNALNQLTWIISAYFVTQTGFILIHGQILTILPTKWVYLFFIFVFELGSLICGVAPSMNVLILGRAIAGVGASGIFASALVVISYATKLEQRSLLFGTVGAVCAFSSVIGPLLSGVFTDKVSWRWCFYINLPLGATAIAVVAIFLPAHRVTPNPLYDGKTMLQKWRALDFVGALLSLGLITTLILPLQWAGNTKEWNDSVVIGLLVTCGALAIIFLLWEWRMGPYAIIPLHYFKRTPQIGAILEVFFVFFAFIIGWIYLPFLYQAKGRTAFQSGINVIPYSLAIVFGIIVSSGVIRVTRNYEGCLIIGSGFAAVAGGLLFTVDAHTSDAKLIGYQILLGFGCGASYQNILLAIQAEHESEPQQIPQSIYIFTFGQLVGGTIGISIGGTIFGNFLSQYLDPLASQLDSYHPGLAQAVKQSVTVVFSLPEEVRVPVIQAYVQTFATMFIITTPVLLLAGLVGLLVKCWNLKKRGEVVIKTAAG